MVSYGASPEMMAALWLADTILLDNATFLLWMRECPTPRFLQDGIRCFSRNDGSAVACGHNFGGQCNIPPLDEGMSYTQVSAGRYHTVLLPK